MSQHNGIHVSQLLGEFSNYGQSLPKVERTVPALTSQQLKLLSEVNLKFKVDIGELSLSAGELVDLLPGHTFEFAFDADTEVGLSLSGEEVAKARFVLRDDRLALEILSISS